MTSTLTLSVAPAQITVRPGEFADVSVTIVNTSTLVSHYEITVVGLPSPDGFRADPPSVELNPNQTGVVSLRVSVPGRGEPYAGRHVLGVLVRSTGDEPVSRCEELALTVPAMPALTAAVGPEIVEGGPSARFTVDVHNTGNTTLPVTLSASDPENKATFAFTPRTVTVASGATAKVAMEAEAAAPWLGGEIRRTLKVTAATGQARAEAQATFVQSPRIHGGLVKVAGLALGVVVVAGSVLGAALLVRGGKQPAAPSPPPPPKASEPTPPTGAKIVDFSQQRGDQLVAPERYTKEGITVSTVLEQAPEECADATGLALRTVTGLGSFLTSARPNGVDLCNTIPIRFQFAAPADTVRLTFGGKGAKYTMAAQLSDGSRAGTDGRSQPGTSTQLTYRAPQGLSIVSVIFGHADPSPTSKDPTIIKQLAFTPAASRGSSPSSGTSQARSVPRRVSR